METIDIQEVEIFKEGFWNGKQYTEKDIDLLVESFGEIGHLVKPFLKLGHTEDQKILQKDGYPSAGWLTNVRKKAGVLVADLKEVPKKIGDLINKKAYGRISMEMFKNLKVENKNYPRVLRAAALLGGDTPAVLSLDDMIDLYENNNYEEIILCTDYKEKEVIMDNPKVEVNIQDIDETKKIIENFTQDIEKFKSDLEVAKKENSDLKEELEKVEFSKKESEVKAYLDSQVEKKKILPAQIDKFKKLLLGEEKDGLIVFGKEDPMSQFDIVKEIIESNETIDFSETSESGDVSTELNSSSKEDDGSDLAEKALKFMKENKVDYADALMEVSKGEK